MGGRNIYIVRITGELTQMSWLTNQSSGTLANKYSDRLIYKKTKDLEVRYYSLLFLEQNDTTEALATQESASLIQCARFIYHCSPHRKAEILHIVLRNVYPAAFDLDDILNAPEWSRTLLQNPLNPYNIIAHFYSGNTKSLVEYYRPEIHGHTFITLF
jgi:hypothetical protein